MDYLPKQGECNKPKWTFSTFIIHIEIYCELCAEFMTTRNTGPPFSPLSLTGFPLHFFCCLSNLRIQPWVLRFRIVCPSLSPVYELCLLLCLCVSGWVLSRAVSNSASADTHKSFWPSDRWFFKALEKRCDSEEHPNCCRWMAAEQTPWLVVPGGFWDSSKSGCTAASPRIQCGCLTG